MRNAIFSIIVATLLAVNAQAAEVRLYKVSSDEVIAFLNLEGEALEQTTIELPENMSGINTLHGWGLQLWEFPAAFGVQSAYFRSLDFPLDVWTSPHLVEDHDEFIRNYIADQGLQMGEISGAKFLPFLAEVCSKGWIVQWFDSGQPTLRVFMNNVKLEVRSDGCFPYDTASYPPMVSPVIESQPRSVNAVEGQRAVLEVTATGETPMPVTYQWYKNGTAITGATQPEFAFQSVLSDSGDYYVIVTDPIGEIRSETVKVSVSTTPAEFTLQVNTIGQGSVRISPEQDSYLYGQPVVAVAHPAPGWIFSGWTIEGSNWTLAPDQSANIIIGGDTTVTASFYEEQSPTPWNADINHDGAVNAMDVQLVINAALGKPIGPAH